MNGSLLFGGCVTSFTVWYLTNQKDKKEVKFITYSQLDTLLGQAQLNHSRSENGLLSFLEYSHSSPTVRRPGNNNLYPQRMSMLTDFAEENDLETEDETDSGQSFQDLRIRLSMLDADLSPSPERASYHFYPRGDSSQTWYSSDTPLRDTTMLSGTGSYMADVSRQNSFNSVLSEMNMSDLHETCNVFYGDFSILVLKCNHNLNSLLPVLVKFAHCIVCSEDGVESLNMCPSTHDVIPDFISTTKTDSYKIQNFISAGCGLVEQNDDQLELDNCLDKMVKQNIRKAIIVSSFMDQVVNMIQLFHTLYRYYTKFDHIWFLTDKQFLTVLDRGDNELFLGKCQIGSCSFFSFTKTHVQITSENHPTVEETLQPLQLFTTSFLDQQVHVKTQNPILLSCNLSF